MTGPSVSRRGVGARAARHLRMRAQPGEGGQTMPLVLGIILVLSLGTVVLVQNTFQQFPIVSKDVVQHEAYRAMQSGVNEYQYAVNANGDFAACGARFVNAAGTPSATRRSRRPRACAVRSASGRGCRYQEVDPPTGPRGGSSSTIPSSTSPRAISASTSWGRPGIKNQYNYQSAVITMQPLNGFLLNVLWLNYDQIDPTVVSQYGGGTCGGSPPTYAYYWTPNPNALQSNCQSLDFITADTLTGNLYSNDTVFVCGSPTFLNVETADPSEDWYEDGGGCSGAPTGDTVLTAPLTLGHSGGYSTLNVQGLGQAAALHDTFTIGLGSNTQTVTLSAAAAKNATTVSVNNFAPTITYPTGTPVNDNATGTWTSGVPIEPTPSDNGTLQTDAATNGCVYQGPTTITLNGAANTMTVNSPGTPIGKPTGAPGTSTSNDPLNAAANTANPCMAGTGGGTVAIPADGVVYVEGCQGSYITTSGGTTYCNGQNYTPLSAAGETGTTGDTVGDAIVQGSVNSPMTIGTDNNIIIDGNICYTDNVSGGTCTGTPAAPHTDVLGLVADNFVEINHPVVSNGHGGFNNASTCSSTLGAGTPTCDLSNPYIDAVILSLTDSFLVNNYTSGSALGTLNIYGTVDEDWRGPVGTFNGGGTIQTGYNKNYVYDPRLVYLSPPYYLNPGTSQWGFASFTVAAGSCKLATGSPNASACTTFP